MAVRYDRGTGMYFSDMVGGGYYSEADAKAAESGGSLSITPQLSPDTLESPTGGIYGQAPDDPGEAPNPNNPGGISDNEMTRRALANRASGTTTANRNTTRTSNPTIAGGNGALTNPGGVSGAFNFQRDSAVGNEHTGDGPAPAGSYVLDSNGNRVYIRGDNYRGESDDINSRMGTVTDQGMVGGVQHLSFEPPAAPPPGGDGGTNSAANQTGAAEDRFNAEDAQNEKENAAAWNSAWTAIDDIEGGDYALSDEARAFQKEGLQQQRDLLKRALGFDPEQYATQFADKALARNIALGRSQGTSAAAQQAGMFGAMEGSAELYAEGARQAAGMEATRLNTAEAAAKAFGELGTMTRNSDENRAQFESNLTVEIADQVSKLTQGQVSLNQQESAMFAEMWMDFAQLQSVYAGMDSDEMIAWWQVEAQKRGQDKQLEAVLASLKAEGKVTSKDLIGGLFQLGGGILGAGGAIGAAYAGKP